MKALAYFLVLLLAALLMYPITGYGQYSILPEAIHVVLASNSFKAFNYTWLKTIELQAPAVTSGGAGAVINITVGVAYPGIGRLFFSALPFTELDTQAAARTAAWVASTLAGVEFNRYDYFVAVQSDTPIIGGPSAGALMTIGFLSILLNIDLRRDVAITGMINPDATIGPVGGLKEKLEAVAMEGYRVFLIPKGQRIYRYPVVVEEKHFFIIVRRIVYKSIDLVEYGEKLGVEVYEVGSIVEALEFFSSHTLQECSFPVESSNLLSTNVDQVLVELLSNASSTLNTASGLAERVENPFYRNSLLSSIRELQNSLTRIESLAHSGYKHYALLKLLSLYSDIAYIYGVSRLLSGNATLEELLSGYGEFLATIDSWIVELEKQSTGYGALELLSLSEADIELAKQVFTRAVSSLKAGESDAALKYATKAFSIGVRAKVFATLALDLGAKNGEGVELLSSLTSLVYSNALSTYSYGSAVISEASGYTDAISEASSYYQVLVNASLSRYTVVYGAGIYVVAYTSYAIHLVFDQDIDKKSVELLASILRTYLCSVGSSIPPAIDFYLLTASEATELSDYRVALRSLLIATTLSQYHAITGCCHVNSLQQNPPTTPLTTPGTNSTEVSSGNTSTEEAMPKLESLELWMLSLAALVLALGIAFLIYAWVKQRYST